MAGPQALTMLIRMKRVQGGVVLACIREGSVALQRTRHGSFFALHDLMHYAVESTLGMRQGFFGLMAAGWDFATFGDREDPRYRDIPAEALAAEQLVGILFTRISERGLADPELLPLLADEINTAWSAALHAEPGAGLQPRQLADILHRFEDLSQRWTAVPLGEHLELVWPAP